ncbi:unnamed protein product [Cuscuta europaea]|uniref:Uncharacterized protein n=1 Tax=Cuscuta europaea TaxID=41803 RepID=A0A9P1E257_CUSEU|nr:unnamed protein product [Cuscuta europaea]
MEQRREHQRSEQKVAASALRVNTEKRVSTQGGKELRRKHGRSDQDASRGKREKVAEMVERGKVEKLAEKVESDWAKEMRHMFGKIRHRLKRHRDRARSPPRHRWNSSLSAQTVSQEEASRSQSTTLPSRTVSPSSKSQTASPCSQVFSSPALADSVRSQVSSFADSSTISSRQIVTISGGDSKSLRYPSTNPSTTLDRGDTISLPLLSVSQESGNPQKTLFEGKFIYGDGGREKKSSVVTQSFVEACRGI